jgi:chloride channel 3/4/5
VAVMLSKWIGDVFSRHGIYESWIQFNQYPYLDNKDDGPAPDVPVSNVMTRVDELVCLNAKQDHTIESLNNFLATTNHRGFPVVTSTTANDTRTTSSADTTSTYPTSTLSSNVLLGYISRTELSYALDVAISPTNNPHRPGGRNLPTSTPCHFIHVPSAPPLTTLDLRPWMDQTPITLNVGSSFQLAVTMFQKLGLRYLLFVERGQLKGLLTKKDIWWVLNAGEAARDGSNFVPGTGVLREENNDEGGEAAEQERGLLDDSSRARSGTVDSM